MPPLPGTGVSRWLRSPGSPDGCFSRSLVIGFLKMKTGNQSKGGDKKLQMGIVI